MSLWIWSTFSVVVRMPCEQHRRCLAPPDLSRRRDRDTPPQHGSLRCARPKNRYHVIGTLYENHERTRTCSFFEPRTNTNLFLFRSFVLSSCRSPFVSCIAFFAFTFAPLIFLRGGFCHSVVSSRRHTPPALLASLK